MRPIAVLRSASVGVVPVKPKAVVAAARRSSVAGASEAVAPVRAPDSRIAVTAFAGGIRTTTSCTPASVRSSAPPRACRGRR